MVLGSVAGLIYANFFLGFFGFPVPDSDAVGSVILALMIYFFSGIVLWKPQILSVRPRSSPASKFDNEIQALCQHLETTKPFLDANLSLHGLAKDLGLSENRLSAILNQGMNTSFYELLSQYRLQEFERLAADPDQRTRPVLELALAAGFNSKASFYRVFQRNHDTTPSAFRRVALE